MVLYVFVFVSVFVFAFVIDEFLQRTGQSAPITRQFTFVQFTSSGEAFLSAPLYDSCVRGHTSNSSLAKANLELDVVSTGRASPLHALSAMF